MRSASVRLPSPPLSLGSALLLLCLAPLVGCGPGADRPSTRQPATQATEVAPPPAPRPRAPEGTRVYDCGRDFLFTVLAEGDDRVRLVLPSGEIVLSRVEATSGDRFEGDGYVYWSRGDQCRLQTPQAIYAGCDSDVEKAIWEDAHRRGVDFRAWGNSPAWQLEIDDGRSIVMEVGTGTERHHFPAAVPTEGEGGQVTYRTLLSGHGLVLTIRPQPCQDPATGAEEPASVEAVLDNHTYRGCGRPLR